MACALTLLILHIAFNIVLAIQVPSIELNDGTKVPVVALGTGRGTAKGHETVEDVRHAVYWAIEAGYRHIDTAAVYFDEPQVGQGIADAIANGLVNREDLFITTKLWSDRHGEEQVVPALQQSLHNLGLTYVDLYLIHYPTSIGPDGKPTGIDYVDTWKGMEKAKKLGLTRSIGVSNFNSKQLGRLLAHCTVKPTVNEIEVNPTFTQEAFVSECHQLGVQVMAYSPFGFLVSRANAAAPAPRLHDPALVKIATKYGKNTSQIVLKYLLERGLIVIPKSTNKDRIAQNIDLFDFHLTQDEVNTIGKFNLNKRVITFDGWQSYPEYPF
nr:venom protein U-MPTX.17-37 [Megalopyge opercularis]